MPLVTLSSADAVSPLFSCEGACRPSVKRGRVSLAAPVGRRAACSRGFTLIELMVVVMILGVLAALVVPRVMSRPDQARVVAAKQDIARIDQQLKLYRLDNSRYPTTEQGLQALVIRPGSGPAAPNWKQYLDKVPNDPWGKPYQYLNPGVHGEIDVFSFGADGQSGGAEFDADIGNWAL
jgi:general secretion pathway protein G